MFLSAINWRHITGALVTGIILQIAGIMNFWLFLGLVAVAISITLAQYLPIGKRWATVILLVGAIFAIGIPTIHGYLERQWPGTYESLQKQSTASDLKGAEYFNQPGLEGVAGQRKLSNDKESRLTANAQSWFNKAARLLEKNKFVEAAEAEQRGREILDQAIAAREADAQYIKEKLSAVKVPAGLWQKTKNFFASLDFGGLAGIFQKGFALRLLVLGVILLGFWFLVLRKFAKSKLVSLVAIIGGAAILWSLFLIFTPEIAPAPPGIGGAQTAAPGQIAKAPGGRTWTEEVQLQPGCYSRRIMPPPGVNFYFEGPGDAKYRLANGQEYSLSHWAGIKALWLKGFSFVSPTGGTVTIHFERRA
jgi:hypothetical protein